MVKQVLKNIKVAEIPKIITELGLSSDQQINLTIEEASDDTSLIRDRVNKEAQKKRLVEEKLAAEIAAWEAASDEDWLTIETMLANETD